MSNNLVIALLRLLVLVASATPMAAAWAQTAQVSKSASPSSGTTLAVGDSVSYTLTATVTDGPTNSPTVLTDVLDPGLTLNSPLPNGCVQAGQNLLCSVPGGTPDGTLIFDYSATVNTSAGSSVDNTVNTADGCLGTCTTSHPVARSVQLTKVWSGIAGDSVSLVIAGAATQASSGSATSGGVTTPATARAIGGASVTLSETFTSGNAANYTSTLTCVRDLDGGSVAATGGLITMPADSAVTCTFDNTRSLATLTLSKQWVDALTGDTATVVSNGFENDASSGPSTSAGNNVTAGTPVTVFAGESGDVTETLSNAGNYDASLACTGNSIALAGNTLTVAPGDTAITCTQTNTRRTANLTLRKTWVDAAVGEAVTVNANGSTTSPITLASTANAPSETDSAGAQPVFAGEVITLSEAFGTAANAADYGTTLGCTGTSGLAGNTLTVGSADTDIVCTYTNTRSQATLTLSKQWVDALSGDTATVVSTGFGNDASSGLSTSTGSNTTTGAPVTVFAGESGDITETLSNAGNYDTSLACTGNSVALAGNTLTIGSGDTAIACTQTNTRRTANLTLRKTWVDAALGETVTVNASGSTTSPITLASTADAASETDSAAAQPVFAGEAITLSEAFGTAANAADYDTALSCTGTSGLAGNTLTVGAADTNVVCTYTNTRQQTTLQINKVWAAGSRGGDQAQLPSTSGLQNNTNAFTSTASVGASSTTVTVYAGEVATLPAETMSGSALPNYSVAVACTGGDLSGTDGKTGNTLEIMPADEGQPIQCTYTNTRNSTTLQLRKNWLNGLPGDTVSLVATGKGTFNSSAGGGPTQTDAGPQWTAYAGEVINITESFGTITSNLYNTTLACTGTSGLVSSPTDPTLGTLTVAADDGPIVCTFTNDRKSTQLYVRKTWGGPVTGATVSIPGTTGFTNNSTPFTSTDPTTTQVGPFEVFAFETGQLPAESFNTGNAADFTRTLSCDGSDSSTGDGLSISIADADAGTPITCTYSNVFVPRTVLDVSKTTTVTSVTEAGEVIPYTITITNNGNVPVSNVTATDPLVQAALTCNPALPVASLAPGASVNCTASYTVQQADIDRVGSGDGVDDERIENTVGASGTDPEGNTVQGGDTVDTTLPSRDYVIDFTKNGVLTDTNGSGAGSAGEEIAYSFTITNNGNSTLQSATVTDPLLPGLSCGPIGPIAPGATVTIGTSPPADVACTGNTYTITQGDIDARGGGDGDIDNTASGTTVAPGGGTASGQATDSTPVDPPRPQLNVDKNANPGQVTAAGQTVTYSFVVTNPGNVTISGIEVTDPKSGLGPITCTPAAPFDLAPGGSVTCTATYVVTQADIDAGGSISNTATADGTYNGQPVIDTDTADVDIDVGPGTAELIKRADKTVVSTVGESITYTFTVRNTSPMTLTDVELIDDTLLEPDPQCSTIASLAPDQTIAFTCTRNVYQVQQSDIDNQGNPGSNSGILRNTATAQATYVDGDGATATATDTSSWSVDLPARAPGLFLTKISDVASVPGAGSAITYTFEVRNTGNTTLTGVSLTDTLLDPALSCTDIASLAPGDTQTFSCTGNIYTVTQNDVDTGSTDFEPNDVQLDNIATVNATVAGTSNTLSASDRNEVNLPVRRSALTLVKRADASSVSAPQTVNYSFVVTNTGNVSLNAVGVTDAGIGLSCPTTTLVPGAQAVFGGAGQPDVTVVCTGTTRAVSQADIDTQTSIENSAVATGTTVPGQTLQATSTLSIPVNRNPSLVFDKRADVASVVLPGDLITYTITGNNNGNVTLQNVQVSDPLLPDLSCTPSQPIAALAPGDDFTCTGTYAASQSDFDTSGGGDLDIDNTATAAWAGGQAQDSASVALPIPQQLLQMVKTAATPSTAQGLDAAVTDAGDTVTYTFVVTNTGNQSLSQVVINDTNLDAAATCDRTTITASGSTETATCTGVHTITQAEMDNGEVVNTATASATPPNSARVTSSPATATVPLVSGARIELTKTASAPTINKGALPLVTDAGDTISYGFLVTNTGNVTLSTITVNDPALTPTAVSCPPGQLAPGAGVTCSSRTYTLTQTNVDAGTFTNTATASGNPPSGASVTNDGSTTTPISDVPGLVLVKSASPTTVSTLGQTVTYSFAVTNSGNTTVNALVIDDDASAFTGTGTLSAITCPVTTLAPGANTTCTATYAITQADLDAGQVDNAASAAGVDALGTAVASPPDDAVVMVDKNAQLTLVKTAAPTSVSAVGQTVTYTFAVGNNGNTTINALAIDDDAAAFTGSGTLSAITCVATTLAPLANTTCTATYAVTQADLDAASGQLTNAATATGTDPGGAPVVSPSDDAVVTVNEQAALTLAKTASPISVSTVGETVTYTFVVSNNGNVTVNALAINETAFSGSGTLSATTCLATTLAPGADTTCIATYAVTQADLNAATGEVTNAATANGTNPGGGPVVSTADDATVTVNENAQLTLVKTASPTSVSTVGQTVTYAFAVSNDGNVTVDNLAINETAFSGTGTAPVITCPVSTLAPGANTICTGTYLVTQADLDAGQITNTATASGIDPRASSVVSVPDDARVDATQAPSLTLVKSTNTPTYDSVGDLIQYSYLVTNDGNVTLTAQIAVDDDRIVSPNRVSCPAPSAGGLVPGGTITCTAVHIVTQADLDAGSVTNIASATDGTTASPTDTVTVTGTQTPAIVLDKTGVVADTNGDGVLGDSGDLITYSFSVNNTGNVVLEPVTVTDPLLPALGCSVARLEPGATATCSATGNTYEIVVADETAGQVVNTATATGDAPGAAPDPTDEDSVTITVAMTPAATRVTKIANPVGGTQVAPADVLTFTVTTAVTRAALHEPVTLTDTLGDGLTLVAVTNPGAYTCNAVNPLVCTLPAGTSQGLYPLVYTVSVDADATGELANAVVASKPAGVDPDPECLSCSTVHPVIPATTTVTKIADPASGSAVDPGTLLTYTLTAVTAGSATTQPLTLTDTLGPGLSFVAIVDPGAFTCSGTLICVLPAGTLPGSYGVVYTARVDVDANGEVGNSVVARNPPGGDPEPVCAICSTSHTVNRPALETRKELTSNQDGDGDGQVGTGDTLTYTVTSTNTGNVTLTNVVVADDMITPATITCPLVAPAQACVLVGTYVVTQADTDSGQLLNQALIIANPPGGMPGLPPEVCPAGSTDPKCTPEVTTPILQRPAITVTKTAALTTDAQTPGVGNQGDVITYTVSVSNSGNVTLNGLVVVDTLQGGAPTTLSCAPQTLAPGQTSSCQPYTHTITEEEAGLDSKQLVNTVVATATAPPAGGAISVAATAEAVITVENAPALLRITKTASVRTVSIGDLVRYTVTVENVGEIDLVDGYLIDTPPLGFSYVEGSLQGDDDDHSVQASGQSPLRVSDLDIAAGNTATLVYLMRVGAGVRPGVQVNQVQAYEDDGRPASNIATAQVLLQNDPMLDESLITGTVFNDRDGDGWQDRGDLSGVRVQGGFAASAYVAGSTTVDRGKGPQPEADASAPLLHGLKLGDIAARQSTVDMPERHQVVIRQRLLAPAFTDDFVLTSAQGITLRMDAAGDTRLETTGDAEKGLNSAAPEVTRNVAQAEGGYVVDYVIRNQGIDERGIPGVRIASVEGLLIETDQFGRYNLLGISAGDTARGRNFVLKMDPSTLPIGSEITTDNPLLRRITGGVPTRFDFGIKVPDTVIEGGTRRIELALGELVFAPESAELQTRYQPVIDTLVEQLRAYNGGEIVLTARGGSEALAFARATAVQGAIASALDAKIRDRVVIGIRTQPDDPSTLLAGMESAGPVLGTVLFDTDSARIKTQFEPLLEAIAQALERSHGGIVSFVGHADRRGTQTYNAALGMRRAQAVYDALSQRLTPATRAKLQVRPQARDEQAMRPATNDREGQR